VSRAVEAKKKWPAQLAFFQAGNEPPLDAGYAAFHRRFVGEVLKQAPSYQVIGPNRAFNLAGVEPAAMEFYLAQCGSTTDVLNWHTYAQPPSTVLAEARYWSGKASGRLRTPGPARVMFTESDAWNQGRSQFDYLMDRAFAFLPEPRIIGNFQYCMEPRGEGGTYRFGVLQPDGEFAANYNGYWAWRNLRGRLVTTTVSTAEPQDSLHALASISRDGKHVTVVAHYGVTWWRPTARFESAHVAMTVALPPGTWSSARSDISWGTRKETPGPAVTAKATVDLDLPSGNAVAITWTRE
jgi:hypothetical protein